MSDSRNVMVFIEMNGDMPAEVSIELICEAGKLAKKLGVAVEGVALGHQAAGKLAELGRFGCARVHSIDDPRLVRFTSVPYAKTVAQVIRTVKPQIVLFGATTTGRDIAPRVASELKCGLTADCTGLEIGECTVKDKTYQNQLLQIRPAFGGNIIATIVSPESSPSMATVREGVMKIKVLDAHAKAEVKPFPSPVKDEHCLTEVLEIIEQARSVDLKGAKIIVCAGMGAGNPEALGLCKELAQTLGGVVAGSRAVVDAKLLAKDHQVGQTGTTVRPNLYIACGVSGQIQHLAGMKDSQRIIAINTDAEAPIFKAAHYRIVGDVCEVIPKMIRAYKGQN